jgi:hypothetical protein
MSGVLSVSQAEAVDSAAEQARYRLTTLICWSVCAALAAADAWAGRQYTDPDGISYLDMSDALLKHNWHLLINPHWSPLYPFLIGVATWFARPLGYWEFPLVHAANFVIFLGALASFEFLMRQAILVLSGGSGHKRASSMGSLPAWRWQLLGYSLFAWSTFVLISGLRRVNPDLCVATFVYLDAGLLLRLRMDAGRSRTCLLLGLTLGFGYLAKAILFPMAFVFMTVAILAIGEWRKAAVPLLLTILVFSSIATPMVILVSQMAGRPSFSESGPLNFAWLANGGDALPFSTFRSSPDLKHPMNLLNKSPDVLGFNGRTASTYSPWFDPQYWNAGTKASFSAERQTRAIGRNLTAFIAGFYMAPMWALIAGGVALFFMSRGEPNRFQQLASSWPLLIPGIAGLTLYTLVLVLPRYIAPFLVLVLLGFFPYIFFGYSARRAKPVAIVTSVLAISIFVFSAMFVVLHLTEPIPILRGPGGVFYRAADSLNKDGVLPGQSVGLIGSGWDAMIWARLARVRIVAQMPLEETRGFWQASDPQVQTEVYDAFARAGAKAVVTAQTPPSTGFTDWQKLGDTPYYVHFLAPPHI